MTDLFPDEKFDVVSHQDPDKHWIGETLPVSSDEEVSNIGTTNKAGDSPFVARADHIHKLGNNVVTSVNIADNQVFNNTSIKHNNVTLPDDTAAYIQFTGIQYGLFALASNIPAGGACLALFRAGDASAMVTILSSTGTVVGGSGTLAGTTGPDGQLNIRARADGVVSRIAFENRTGAQRVYIITFLSLNTAADPPGAWTII